MKRRRRRSGPSWRTGPLGTPASRVVIEEFLTGPEVSVLAFTDGTAIAPMVSSMDHKRAGDGDTGLNHRRHGHRGPQPLLHRGHRPGMHGHHLPADPGRHAAEGCPFKGCLYFGLMLTPGRAQGHRVQLRFGDPETQVVLPLLKTDLLTVMQAVENETLENSPWSGGTPPPPASSWPPAGIRATMRRARPSPCPLPCRGT